MGGHGFGAQTPNAVQGPEHAASVVTVQVPGGAQHAPRTGGGHAQGLGEQTPAGCHALGDAQAASGVTAQTPSGPQQAPVVGTDPPRRSISMRSASTKAAESPGATVPPQAVHFSRRLVVLAPSKSALGENKAKITPVHRQVVRETIARFPAQDGLGLLDGQIQAGRLRVAIQHGLTGERVRSDSR